MKKMIAVAALALVLVGCGLSQDQIEQSKASCHQKDGQPSFLTTSDGAILQVKCTVDGIAYRVGESSGRLYEGKVVR